MKKRMKFFLIVTVTIIALYIITLSKVKELKTELEQVTKMKEELVVQVDNLQNITNSNNEEKNDNTIDNETISVDANKYLKKEKELYGLGVIKKDVNMQSITITNPSSEYRLKENQNVEIIDVFIDTDNKEWVLVKDSLNHGWGFVESQYVKNVEFNRYYKESEWDINGFRIGEPFSNAIQMMGYDYTIMEPGEYTRELIATFKGEGETRVFFNPIFMVIERISTTDKNITVNGLFQVGDNVYESISLLNKSYNENKENNYVIIKDSSSYYIILYYDENNKITSILYRTCEVDA